MRQNQVHVGQRVVLNNTPDAVIWVVKHVDGFHVMLQDADAPGSAWQRSDTSLIIKTNR